MKRFLVLLLAVVFLLGISACGSIVITENPSDAQNTSAAQQNNNQQQEEPKDSELTTEPPVEDTLPEFDEIVAIDNDECLVKITGFEHDSIWGYELKVYLENRSDEKTYMYTVQDGSVNGVMWDPFFATEVAPGKKKNDEISFSNDELEKIITEFTDIELLFRVYDSNDWMADDVAKETVHVYPLGEDKVTRYEREPQPTDTVVVDNDSITFIITEYYTDEIWGYTAKAFIVNKTDAALTFSLDDVSVNGFMCDPFWAKSVEPGKVAFSNITWSESSFEENGITDVEEIEMTLRAYNSGDWFADDIYKETVTLNP